MADLPKGWIAKQSSSTGRKYYYNEYTKATQWEIPEPVGHGQVDIKIYLPTKVVQSRLHVVLKLCWMYRIVTILAFSVSHLDVSSMRSGRLHVEILCTDIERIISKACSRIKLE